MAKRKKELIELIKKYCNGKATEEEKIFVEKYYQYFDKAEKISESLSDVEIKETQNKIFTAIHGSITQTPVIPIYQKRRFTIAAASVLLIISVSIVLLYSNKTNTQEQNTNVIVTNNDVLPPATNRATITLSNGQKVYLDSAGNGSLAEQGSISLQKLANGQIIYKNTSANNSDSIIYNTLNNPKGSKAIHITLSDGSSVWLNAASSLTYPISFTGKERTVSINGEAYFEVAHNKNMPFKVLKGNMEVAVLGTSFNVNAYDDEETIKVTLLTGSVKLRSGLSASMLQPGQQAIVDNGIQVSNNVDLAVVMAWKSDYFNFVNEDLKGIMRQISKWYNVEIEFKSKLNDRYTIKQQRDIPLSELLKYIELSGGVHFKIVDKKIIVNE